MIERFLKELHTDESDPEGFGTYRPALRRLTLDAHDLIYGGDDVPGLKGGFDTRTTLIHWEQRLSVRTLGEVPQFVYQGIASQLASPGDRPLVEALLDDESAPRSVEARTRMRRRVVIPAFNRAFRRLRIDATEYLNEMDAKTGTESKSMTQEKATRNPAKQSNIAMRPSLEELDTAQQFVLDQLLPHGLDSRDEILEWGDVLVNATHGEPIYLPTGETIDVGAFVERHHDRGPYTELLTDPGLRRPREAWVARFLIPTFNAAVREILPTSGELPDGETEGFTAMEVA